MRKKHLTIQERIASEQLAPTKILQKEKFEKMTAAEHWLYYLISRDQNLSVFISGIISSIPITLLLNLVTTKPAELVEVPYTLWYVVIYAVMLIASGIFCIQSWKIALCHIKVDNYRNTKNKAEVKEMDIYLLFEGFELVHTELFNAAKRLLFSGVVTTCCVVAIFVLINI